MVLNIPIILSNLTLKTVFLQTLDQVNINYKYKFYLLDPAELPNCPGTDAYLDQFGWTHIGGPLR